MFLERIEQTIPCGEWGAIIQPYYYEGERGDKSYALHLMLRLHILQDLYDLSDEAVAAEVIDSRASSEFRSQAQIKRRAHEKPSVRAKAEHVFI